MKNKNKDKQIAEQRIHELFKEANKTYKKDQDLANRYVQLAKKISLKHKTPFNKNQKQQYCKKCQTFLIPGHNCRIRTHKGKKTILCLKCKNISRYIYKK
ncbi:ribonuclease P [Candidatus Woesearchaeota archaeon]|nr:ribonuclease P [Candidatus Woesearchaeota archaeon]